MMSSAWTAVFPTQDPYSYGSHLGKSAKPFIDEGPGISEEHRAKVLERYYRIDKGRSSQTGGSGLGLAIAQSAAEANGGRIELETEQDKGSIFRIVLPNRGDSR